MRQIALIAMLLILTLARCADYATADGNLPEVRTDSLGDPLPPGALIRLGTQRFHHPSSVIDLALSPDEKTVVTIGSDELIVWETATGKMKWRASVRQQHIELPGAAYGVRAVAFASDNSRFFTPGGPNQFVVWDVESGKPTIVSFDGKQPLVLDAHAGFQGSKAIDVTRDGRRLTVGSIRGVVVCNAEGERLFEIANRPEQFINIQEVNRDRLMFGYDYSYAFFSPDEKLLAAVTSDSPEEIRLFDANAGTELRRIKLKSRLVRFAFSPDGQRIVTTERDVSVRLYAVDSGLPLWSYDLRPTTTAESYTCAVAFSPDARLVAACAPIGADYDIRLCDAATGKEVDKLSGHTWKPWAVAFSADSKMLYSSGWDGAVRRWDVGTRRQLPLPSGIRASGVVSASPDGRTLAYVDDSGVIHLVEANDGREIRTLELPGTGYTQLTFSPDSKQLAGGGAAGDRVRVAVWDIATAQVVRRWDWPKGRDPHSDVESLCFRPDGKQLAAAVFRQSSAYLWDLTTGNRVAAPTHQSIYGLSFSPDGKTLATAGWDSIVRFWDTTSGENQRTLKVPDVLPVKDGDHRMYTVCYAPSGGIFATAHLDGKVRIWNMSDLALRREFRVNARFIYGCISFSPDSSLLATGDMARNVALWDPLSGELVWDTGRHQNYVYAVSFGSDSRTLVSGGQDGVCYRWDLKPTAMVPEQEMNVLWKELAGDGKSAYRAIWAMKELPARSVAFLGQKLRRATSVMDLERIVVGLSPEEAEQRVRLARILVDKDERVVLSSVAQRSLALLVQLGTDDSLRLVRELAERKPEDELSQLAAAALEATK